MKIIPGAGGGARWAVIYQGTDSKGVGGSRGTTGMVQDDASGIVTGHSKPQRMYGGRDYLKNPEWQNHDDQATVR